MRYLKRFVMWVMMEYHRGCCDSILSKMENSSEEELSELSDKFDEHQDKWWSLFEEYYELEPKDVYDY